MEAAPRTRCANCATCWSIAPCAAESWNCSQRGAGKYALPSGQAGCVCVVCVCGGGGGGGGPGGGGGGGGGGGRGGKPCWLAAGPKRLVPRTSSRVSPSPAGSTPSHWTCACSRCCAACAPPASRGCCADGSGGVGGGPAARAASAQATLLLAAKRRQRRSVRALQRCGPPALASAGSLAAQCHNSQVGVTIVACRAGDRGWQQEVRKGVGKLHCKKRHRLHTQAARSTTYSLPLGATLTVVANHPGSRLVPSRHKPCRESGASGVVERAAKGGGSDGRSREGCLRRLGAIFSSPEVAVCQGGARQRGREAQGARELAAAASALSLLDRSDSRVLHASV